jgi:enoyl-CoA hydratase/carnithine racemase
MVAAVGGIAVGVGTTMLLHFDLVAREIGLVNTVYPDSEFIDKAFAQAQKPAQQPPASVRLTKALLKRSISGDIADTMAEELRYFSERLDSAECGEALSAFFERRKPDFSGLE